MFANAGPWLAAMHLAADGVTVTVTRGATVTTGVRASPGGISFVSRVDGATRIQIGDRDYLIRVSDYPHTSPALGDRISEVIAGATRVYEVIEPDTGEPAVRESGQSGIKWRIHTKRVS